MMVKICGIEYDSENLSNEIKSMLVLHKQWQDESKVLKIEYMKTNAAIRDLSREIEALITEKKETSIYTSTISDSGSHVVEFK